MEKERGVGGNEEWAVAAKFEYTPKLDVARLERAIHETVHEHDPSVLSTPETHSIMAAFGVNAPSEDEALRKAKIIIGGIIGHALGELSITTLLVAPREALVEQLNSDELSILRQAVRQINDRPNQITNKPGDIIEFPTPTKPDDIVS